MQRLTEAFKNLPKPYKWGLILGVVVALIAISTFTNRITAYIERRAFEKELKVEKDLRQKDVERGDLWEARAIAAESEKIKFQLALEVEEKNSAKAKERIADAKATYDKEVQRIDADLDACQRYAELRAKLGLKEVPCQHPE